MENEINEVVTEQATEDTLRQPAADTSLGEGGKGTTAAGDEDSSARETAQTGDAETAPAGKSDDAEQRMKALSDTLGKALAKAALRAEGVSAEKLARAARLLDVDGIDPMAEDAEAQYAERVKALIQEIPELKPAPQGANTGSSGEHARRGESANDKALAAFRAGMNM